MKKEQPLFWADQIANEILTRRSCRYIKKPVPKLKKFVVKTSASASGVLHIGRLSDTIRGESVVRALIDRGKKAQLLWVIEDMDPLRKIPKGVADGYLGYIGRPVTDIPDPKGCHESYAEHFVSGYKTILNDFVSVPLPQVSMREEYRKGTFKPFIKKIMRDVDVILDIQNEYRKKYKQPLIEKWSPWRPICEKCRKIITTRVIDIKEGKVEYVCEDYKFKENIAKGCGHKGLNDPLKGEGKLLWKSEWAAQWACWQIVSEGAGKEYQVPGSAYWINAEIVERVFGWPAPVPIFYEHLMIENKKMSASLGNVVYPQDWLSVAPPELLRYFYNKKLMKTRSFSWGYLPELYHEYDGISEIYFGDIKIANKKEKEHAKRLYEISQLKKINRQNPLPFSYAAIVCQTLKEEGAIVEALKRTGHYEKSEHAEIMKRIEYARKWIGGYAPAEYKLVINEIVPHKIRHELSSKQLSALKVLMDKLQEKDYKEGELHSEFKKIAAQEEIEPIEFFKGAYLTILNREHGPNLANLVLTLGQDRIVDILKSLE